MDATPLVRQEVILPIPFLILMAIGGLTLGYYIFLFAKCMLEFAAGGQSLADFGAFKGKWAVVTGCTSGIGFEFVLQLAKTGYNVVMISRDKQKLAECADQIKKKAYGADLAAIPFDFQKATSQDWQNLHNELQELDVRVLVNNVGRSHDHPEYFADLPAAECEAIIRINVDSLVNMTRIVLPNMQKARNGLILNIGSFASLTSTPLLSVYAGTKSFMYSFSQAIGAELEEKGITVSYINSYLVVSPLSKIRKASFFVPTPARFVDSVLTHIGQPVGSVRSQPFSSTPFLPHALIQLAIELVGIWSVYFWFNKRTHKAIRDRALKKSSKAK